MILPRKIFRWIRWLFFIYLPKLYQYATLLWNDVDYQFDDILKLIALKTKRTREYLTKEGGVEVDWKHMKEVELLCHRILEDDYLKEDNDEIHNKYPRFSFSELFGGGRSLLVEKYHTECMTLYKRQYRIHQQDIDRLFWLLYKHLYHWWS